MGDTSSGKSSILSAISGITFPSDKNLTTICPTQLNLTRADTFSGSVSLLRKGDPKRTPPVIPRVEISKLEEVTTNIERLTQQLKNENQQISEDSIIIDVSGPSFPNLTLIDLPGLVRTVQDGEDKAIILQIRNLVKSYLEKSRTIILAIVPATVDFHNSEILEDAQKVDPEGLRTIAIITKPDLIDRGAEESVIDLLMNKKKFLKEGYHAVRCRGQRDLDENKTIEEGRNMEMEFFKNHDVWKKVDQKYLGVDTLTEKLVILLERIIMESLPSVRKEIEENLISRAQELNKMGEVYETSSSRRFFYSKLVDQYMELMNCSFSGNYTDNHGFSFQKGSDDFRLRAALRIDDTEFRETVNKSNIDISFLPESDADSKKAFIAGDMAMVNVEGVKKLVKVAQVHGTRNISYLLPNGGMTDYLEAERVKVLDYSAIKKKISDNRGDELAIFPPYRVFVAIITDYVKEWSAPMTKILDCYVARTSRSSEAIMNVLFHSKMNFFCSEIVKEFISKLEKENEKGIIDVQNQECSPYTQNHYLYDNLAKLRNKELFEKLECLAGSNDATPISMAMLRPLLKSIGIGTDSNEVREAIEMHMALVAYLKVAKKRFIDTIPMLLDLHFIKKFLNNVKDNLLNVEDDALTRVFQESKEVAQTRVKLNEEIERLKKSKKEVAALFFN